MTRTLRYLRRLKVNGRMLDVVGEVPIGGRRNGRVIVYEGDRVDQAMSPLEAERLGRALIDAAKAARGMR